MIKLFSKITLLSCLVLGFFTQSEIFAKINREHVIKVQVETVIPLKIDFLKSQYGVGYLEGRILNFPKYKRIERIEYSILSESGGLVWNY